MTTKKFIIVFLLFALISFSGCATKATHDVKKGDVWTGNMNGDVNTEFTLSIMKTPDEKGYYIVSGDLDGTAVVKGRGSNFNLDVEGKMRDGMINADFSGTYVLTGSTRSGNVKGSLVGTLEGTQGFGTYEGRTAHGRVTGKWTAVKKEDFSEY